jgi:ribonuclease HI
VLVASRKLCHYF